MKALTIRQPYAELVARGIKTLENRKQPTTYRGPLVLHAGLSEAWVRPEHRDEWPDMAFGAVVGVAQLRECWALSAMPVTYRTDPYANGPYCWLLAQVVRLETPIPWPGAQGLWTVPRGLWTRLHEMGAL